MFVNSPDSYLINQTVERLDTDKLSILNSYHAVEFLSILWPAPMQTIAETLTLLDPEQLNLTVSSYLLEIFSLATLLSEVVIYIL